MILEYRRVARRRPAALVASAICLLAYVLASALTSAAADDSPLRSQSYTLENGMDLVVIEDHRTPVVTHMLFYRVGGADDPPGKSGLAHFFEHLMFKGTPSLGSGEYQKMIARNGGRMNASTGSDMTNYYVTIAADRLELVMRAEADRMVNLTLDEETVLTERDVILEERRMRVDNSPGARFSERMSALQYLVHPYGTPVVGWENEIAAQVREDMIPFYRRHYAPDNAFLVVAGDVDPEAVFEMAKTHYGPIPPSGRVRDSRRAEPEPLAAKTLEMFDARVRQPVWRRSWLAPSSHSGESKHALPLQVLSVILGSGPTSRLHRKLVVETEISLGAYSGYDSDVIDMSRFAISARPAEGHDLSEIEGAVDVILQDIMESGVTATELIAPSATFPPPLFMSRTARSDWLKFMDLRWRAAMQSRASRTGQSR